MAVRIYQLRYGDVVEGEFDPAFAPYDCRDKPEPDRREVAHMARFYRERCGAFRESADGDCVGLVSPKFGRKTKLAGRDFIGFVEQSPGYDVYFINPFPQLAYLHFNVWEQGEYWHPGLCELADRLFAAADLPISVRALPRNGPSTLLYCNYWVGNAAFWTRFVPFLDRLLAAVGRMGADERKKLFALAPHYEPAKYFAFVFERVFSTFLVLNPDIRALPYRYPESEIPARCQNDAERAIIGEWRGAIDAADAAGRSDAAHRQLFADIEAELRRAVSAGPRRDVLGRAGDWFARLFA